MFNNPTRPNSSAEEGSITEVDSIRKVCKVKTLSGQNLTDVLWAQPSGGAGRGGDRVTPNLGDRVMIDTRLGYPIITSFLPKLQNLENATPLWIDTGETLIDTGNFSSSGKNVLGDQNAPRDMLVGDRVLSSSGGGLVALLRAGSVVLRSSRFAEVFLSKIHDLVRISSRNFEHFSDVGSDVIRNIKGRIYRHVGYSKKIEHAKVEAYTFNQYYGDVALGEEFQTNYTKSETLPTATDIIFKEQVLDRESEEPFELMKREIYLNGDQDLVVKNSDGTIFTRIKCTKDEVTITFKDINVIHVSTDEIAARKNGDPRSVVIKEDKILSTFTDATVLMNASGILSTYKDGTVNMSASSIIMKFSGSEHKVNATGAYSTAGGHFVNVTAGGVSFG
jgi:hypothetical protein